MFYMQYYHKRQLLRAILDLLDMPILKLWAFAESRGLITDRNQGLDQWFYNRTDKIWRAWGHKTPKCLSKHYHRRSCLARCIFDASRYANNDTRLGYHAWIEDRQRESRD